MEEYTLKKPVPLELKPKNSVKVARKTECCISIRRGSLEDPRDANLYRPCLVRVEQVL